MGDDSDDDEDEWDEADEAEHAAWVQAQRAHQDSAGRKTITQLFAGLTWVARLALGLTILCVGIAAPTLLWQALPAVSCFDGPHVSIIEDIYGPGCRSIFGTKYATWGDFMSSFPGVVTAVAASLATTLLTTVVQQVLPDL